MKPTGSLYLHCDPTASHYLKTLLDAIFGRRQFRNEILWCYKENETAERWFPWKHDIILFYSKTDEYTFNIVRAGISEAQRKRYNIVVDGERYANMKGKLRKLNPRGAKLRDWWDIPIAQAKERTGYPTQKPLELYERFIRAGSNRGDTVLDPFAGCATTCVAAERQGRRWVGIDIWAKAKAVVLDRMAKERMALPEAERGDLFTEEIRFTDKLPDRTDDGEHAAPFLRVKERIPEPRGPKMSRQAMYRHLLGQNGPKCQGCDREFDDPRYLELDHNTPRSDGGLNHISNRILLCGPCNRLKSNTFTLSGLRRENAKLGYLADSIGEHPLMREIREERESRPRDMFD